MKLLWEWYAVNYRKYFNFMRDESESALYTCHVNHVCVHFLQCGDLPSGHRSAAAVQCRRRLQGAGMEPTDVLLCGRPRGSLQRRHRHPVLRWRRPRLHGWPG